MTLIQWSTSFSFIFFYWFLYFNCFKFQKIIENSFLVQKIWKNYEKYFWLFSFWFLFFHKLILCFGIIYKFYTYLICFKCLKILLYIFKFWKNYGMIQWYCDKYWWPYFIFVSDFTIVYRFWFILPISFNFKNSFWL